MPKLFVTDRSNRTREIEGKPGFSVMELIRDAGVADMLALCGGVCNCGTCHVHLDEACMSMAPPRTENEDAMLEMSPQTNEFSRLGCQITYTEDMDGLRVTIAAED
jgi:ferredoxin, 2Fe-2S